MSTLTQPGLFKSSSYQHASLSGGAAGNTLVASLRTAGRYLLTWHAENRAIEAMRGLSDHELRDIGIERGEIEAAARGDLAHTRFGR